MRASTAVGCASDRRLVTIAKIKNRSLSRAERYSGSVSVAGPCTVQYGPCKDATGNSATAKMLAKIKMTVPSLAPGLTEFIVTASMNRMLGAACERHNVTAVTSGWSQPRFLSEFAKSRWTQGDQHVRRLRFGFSR